MMTRDGMRDEERRRNNLRAWRELTGYETSSGCPMWDRTPNVCIPKGVLGIGYTVNCWALCCCFLCEKPLDSTYRPTKRVWVFYLVICVGLLVLGLGVMMAGWLSHHCQGFHDNGMYFNNECPVAAASGNASMVCCHLPCGSTDNTCETLQELGGGVTLGAGIAMALLGCLLVVPGAIALGQNQRALLAEQAKQQLQQQQSQQKQPFQSEGDTGQQALLPAQEEPDKV